MSRGQLSPVKEEATPKVPPSFQMPRDATAFASSHTHRTEELSKTKVDGDVLGYPPAVEAETAVKPWLAVVGIVPCVPSMNTPPAPFWPEVTKRQLL